MAALYRLAPAVIPVLAAAALAAPASAADCTPARQLAAADAYIAALGDRALAGAVPFAPNAVRFENGLQTGFSGEQLRGDLDRHLQYSIMDAPRVTARTVAPGGDHDLLNYRFIVPVRIAGQRIVDAPTDEDFRIPRSTCLITRIDARITITPPR